jgi:hypothetical protein
LLGSIENQREKLQTDLRSVLAVSSTLKQKLKLVELSRENRIMKIENENYVHTEEGMEFQNKFENEKICVSGSRVGNIMKFLYEGDGYTEANRFEAARKAYDNQIVLLRYFVISLLSFCLFRFCTDIKLVCISHIEDGFILVLIV